MATLPRTTTARKCFSVQQANAALPLVRAIVRDIVTLARTVHDRQERMDRLHPGGGLGELVDEHREELRQLWLQMQRDRQQMQEYADELAKLGVELKDRLLGLVDFPSQMEGREVCLCWMHGEPEVAFWHEREAGFAGRKCLKPLSSEGVLR